MGEWIRQDPGFPDALFKSNTISPNPGIEIKAWFPFATEITARFKDSITIFSQDNIDIEYYGAAEPPVRCGESHLSGLTEPPHFVY